MTDDDPESRDAEVWAVMEVRDWYPKLCAICATEPAARSWLAEAFASGRIVAAEPGDYRVERWPVHMAGPELARLQAIEQRAIELVEDPDEDRAWRYAAGHILGMSVEARRAL